MFDKNWVCYITPSFFLVSALSMLPEGLGIHSAIRQVLTEGLHQVGPV